MTLAELDELKADLRAVRKAVDRHSPLLREIAATDFFARLSFPYALLIIAFGAGTHVLLGGSSDLSLLPGWWTGAFWIFLILLMVVGGIVKIAYFNKRIAATSPGTGFWEAYLSIWASEWLRSDVPLALVAGGVSVFVALGGHTWYILPVWTVFFGIALNGMGHVVRRPEYFVSGWYGVVAGTLSLFTLEAAPWLWLAALVGGLLLVFGIGGLVAGRPDRNQAADGSGEGR